MEKTPTKAFSWLKAATTPSRRIQLGEGLSRGLLRDCEIIANLRFIFVSSSNSHVTDDRRNNVEALRLIGEAGKCKRLESQQEQAAFNMRISSMMCG